MKYVLIGTLIFGLFGCEQSPQNNYVPITPQQMPIQPQPPMVVQQAPQQGLSGTEGLLLGAVGGYAANSLLNRSNNSSQPQERIIERHTTVIQQAPRTIYKAPAPSINYSKPPVSAASSYRPATKSFSFRPSRRK